uniref:G-protein coupled receptors family 1 profile domain-containing protein n=1 Tax=Mycena chlorophos TaxID=658473 RepID=A0ABQ0LFR0_MYCCL|nr:predicted protein [Mycena chlorophos]
MVAALKVVWFTGCLSGIIPSVVGLIALGQCFSLEWATYSAALCITAIEGAFCLGFIWEMDPFKMPRAFCIAQTVTMHCASFFLVGITLALFYAATVHIIRPKRWVNIKTAFQWRKMYIFLVILYPASMCAIQLSLMFALDAIQPADGLFCGPTNPLWIRLTGEALPMTVLIPFVYLVAISLRGARRTMAHVQRAQKDGGNDIRRRMRRQDSARAALTAHAAAARTRNSTSSSRTVASTGFPMFAPWPGPGSDLTVQEHEQALDKDKGDDKATVAVAAHLDLGLSSEAGAESSQTSDAGHGDSELDLGVMMEVMAMAKDGDEEAEMEDGGTYTLSYREGTPRAPSRVSHVANVYNQRSTIRVLIVWQIITPFTLFIQSISTINDMAHKRTKPSSFGTVDVVLLCSAWAYALTTLSIPMVRRYIWARYVPRWPWLRGPGCDVEVKEQEHDSERGGD